MRDFLHHLFIPRHSNNHRSKLLHHDSLLTLILFLFLCSFVFSSVHRSFPQVLGITSSITPEQLLSLTNQQREQHGLKPLHLDSELSQAATQKAADMFAKDYWAHVAPDGVTPWVFIKGAGYDYLYAGENLARGFTTANDVVTAWMNSPSHRDNMLSPNYNDVGFAVATGNLVGSDTTLVVQEFGSRYIAKSEDNTASVTYPSPSQAFVAGNISPSPILSVSPTLPLVQGQVVPTHSVADERAVAAIQNQPLIDSKNLNKEIAFGIVALLLIVLILDAIIIERKQIARVVAHNLDHIIYLVMILLVVILISRGLVL